MKLKEIIAQDIVKLNEESFEKVKKYFANEGTEITDNDNKFQIVLVQQNGSQTEYTYIPKNDSLFAVFYSTVKKNFEVIEPMRCDVRVSDEFSDAMKFNSFGRKVLNSILRLDARKIEKNYIGIKLDGENTMITYIPFGKLKYFTDGDYWHGECRSKYEQEIKPVKFFNSLLETNNMPHLTEDEIENLIGVFCRDINAHFEIVSGDDISKYYNGRRYMSQDNTLGNSCMRYSDFEEMGVFNIYAKSPDCKMLILKDNNQDKILGRAILWNVHSDDGNILNGKQLLDRIYVTNNAFVTLFTEYAKKNGMAYLPRQTFGSTEVLFEGKTVSIIDKKIYVNIEKDDKNPYECYPYIDTFTLQYDSHKNRLYPRIRERSGLVCTYDRTGGKRDITGHGSDLGYECGGRD